MNKGITLNPHGNGWRASLDSDPRYWEYVETQMIALGKLIVSCAEFLNISVRFCK